MYKGFRKHQSAGMMTVELLLALFLWAIFLTGIFGLWFALFGPNIPLLQYADQENFYIKTTNFLNVSGFRNKYIDRGVVKIMGAGFSSVSTDWVNGFGQKGCRGIEINNLIQVNTPAVELDGFNIASAMLVRSKYIYLASNSSSTTDPDIYTLSLSNPENPYVMSKLNTGPGLVALSVAGYVLFAANTSINSQAQAFDISNPENISLKWSFKVSGSQGTSTALGKSIASNGKKVFLGTAKNASAEVFELNAATGQLVNEREVSAGVNGLYLNKSKLFVSTPLDPELSIFSSANLQSISSFDAPGGSGNGRSMDVVNDYIFFGRTVGGNELIWLDVSSSTAVSKITDVKIGASIDSILEAGKSLIILTSHSQKELQIWKIDENKLVLNQVIDLPARAVGVGCSNGYVYVALATQSPILIFKPV